MLTLVSTLFLELSATLSASLERMGSFAGTQELSLASLLTQRAFSLSSFSSDLLLTFIPFLAFDVQSEEVRGRWTRPRDRSSDERTQGRW